MSTENGWRLLGSEKVEELIVKGRTLGKVFRMSDGWHWSATNGDHSMLSGDSQSEARQRLVHFLSISRRGP